MVAPTLSPAHALPPARSCAPVELLARHTPDTPGDATASRGCTFPQSPSNPPPSSPPLLLLATSSPSSRCCYRRRRLCLLLSYPPAYTRPTDRDISPQPSHRSSALFLALALVLSARPSLPAPNLADPWTPPLPTLRTHATQATIFHSPHVGRPSRGKESFNAKDALATSHSLSPELLRLPVTKHPELLPRLDKSRLQPPLRDAAEITTYCHALELIPSFVTRLVHRVILQPCCWLWLPLRTSPAAPASSP